MGLLNFSYNSFQVIIGGVDFSAAVQNLTLRRPIADISTPYSWSGEILFSTPLDETLLPESLDDFENPVRFARGQYPVQILINGILVCTVRIAEYFYNEIDLTATATVADILNILSFRTPPLDWKIGLGFTIGDATPVSTFVSKLLTLANVPSFDVSNLPGFFDVPKNKFGESFIQFSQQIASERGYWLYCDPQEVVRAAPYPNNVSTTPLFLRSRAGVEKFDRQHSPDVPADYVRAAGSCDRIIECNQGIDSTEDFGVIQVQPVNNQVIGPTLDLVLERRETTTILTDTLTLYIKQTIVEQALGAAMPNGIWQGNTLAVDTERCTETSNFMADGRIINYEKFSYKMLGIVLPDDYADSLIIVPAERITEEYSNPQATTAYDDKVLRQKITTNWSLYPLGSGGTSSSVSSAIANQISVGPQYALAIKSQVTETWTNCASPVGPPATNLAGTAAAPNALISSNPNPPPLVDRYTYKKKTYQRQDAQVVPTVIGTNGIPEEEVYSLGTLVYAGTDTKEYSTPPEWPTSEPDFPIGQVAVVATRQFTPLTYTPTLIREYEQSFSTLTTFAEVGELASLVGIMQHQRSRQRLISMPVPSEWLHNTTPFCRVDCHNGSFIMDAPVLVLGDDGLELSFTGNYLGAIAPIPDPAPCTDYSPFAQGLGGLSSLNVGAVSAQLLVVGGAIALDIPISGGTPPYTFSVSGLPNGLSVNLVS